MFKINLTPATIVAFVLGAAFAQSAFAGAGGGSTGDGVGIARVDNGALLSIADPGRDGNAANYRYDLWGADGDTRVVGDWNGDGNPTVGAVRVDNNALLWILDFSGTGAPDYQLFGSDGDIPVVGDWDPAQAGDEIGFVRRLPGEGTLLWVLKDNTPGDGFSQEVFGADTDDPAPGNWDGDAGNGDERGLVRDDGPSRLWITEGTGGALEYNLFGAAGDTATPGDYTGDGNSNFGVRPSTGDGNVFILDGTSIEYLGMGVPTDEAFNPSTLGQP